MAEEAKKEGPAPAGAPKAAEKKTNGRTPSAKKRDIQSLKRQIINNSFKASVKTAIRAFEQSVAQGDKAEMLKKLNMVYSLLDKGVKTNKFKMNKASRTKSRLTSRVPA
jgi:small subunit ribosomal protein S20